MMSPLMGCLFEIQPPDVALYNTLQMATILFNSYSETHRCLSNFYAVPIVLDGLIWPSTEHYY